QTRSRKRTPTPPLGRFPPITTSRDGQAIQPVLAWRNRLVTGLFCTDAWEINRSACSSSSVQSGCVTLCRGLVWLTVALPLTSLRDGPIMTAKPETESQSAAGGGIRYGRVEA